MIESVTYPANLADWNDQTNNFYIELFGETHPYLDMTYAEVLPVGSKEDDPTQTKAVTPIYQYWWTLSQSGSPAALQLRQNLQDDPDPAARVYLYFPLGGGWRIKEFAASVKYLTPIVKHVDWLTRLGDVWNKTQPFVDEAAQLTALLPKPLDASSNVLSALAKLKLNEVPPVDGFAWSVGKVTTKWQGSVMEGVMWTLPKKMFTDIGGRITGSLAVSFIPAPIQDPSGMIRDDYSVFQRLPIQAHARIYLQQDKHSDAIFPSDRNENDQQPAVICLPDRQKQEFVELYIQPTVPPVPPSANNQ